MRSTLTATLGLLWVMISGASPQASAGEATSQPRSPEPPGYRIAKSIELPSNSISRASRIEVLEDERLTPEVREGWWGADYRYYCAQTSDDPEAASLCSSIREQPLRGAIVRLTSRDGRLLDQRTFDRELAEIARVHLVDSQLLFSVTVDYSIGFGSYAGPTTFFVAPRSSRLRWLAASDAKSAAPAEIRLGSTLKSAWQTVPRTGTRNFDILAVRCQPDYDRWAAQPPQSDPFLVIYERFTFDGQQWVRSERRESGFWEEDDGFPSPDKFPR